MTSEGTNFYTTGNIHHYQEQAQQYQQINNQYNSQYNNSLYGNTYGGQYNQPYPTGLNYVPPPTKTSWLSAFGTGSLDNEPSLLEELEINPKHMCDKTFSVLNPFRSIDGALVEDADCWGPILFLLLFAASLLLAGKSLFSFIYGVAAIGLIGIYTILNLMSETGIDGQRTISVLGYCLLPMAILSWISIALPLQGPLGLILGSLTVLWCTLSSSSMFVTALGMREQRVLVAYPIGLLYCCFAIMTIF